MDTAEILSRFDAETRVDPPAQPGLTREWSGGVLRAVGAYNFIGWWELSPEAVDDAIAEQTAFFRSRNERVEWKVYSHDLPENLQARLQAAGWVPTALESFLVFDLSKGDLPRPPTSGVEVRRVTSVAGVEDYVAAAEAAFGVREDHWLQTLPSRLGDPSLEIYVAYAGDAPVASARLEMTPGTAFAGLYGGATAPAHRARGIYCALVGARAALARSRGYRFLTVDALETSRPILERLGFERLASVRGWILEGS